METEKIKETIEEVVKNSFFNDHCYLLKNNICERSITHQLAVHLSKMPLFSAYDIDCEYSGFTEPPWYKVISSLESEYIVLLEKKLKELRSRKPQNLTEGIYNIHEAEEGYTFVSRVHPDIIIHKRGTNEKNLCVIEVKISGKDKFGKHDESHEYDFLKLEKYVMNDGDLKLGYKLGVFIELEKGCELSRFNLTFYERDKEPVLHKLKYNIQ